MSKNKKLKINKDSLKKEIEAVLEDYIEILFGKNEPQIVPLEEFWSLPTKEQFIIYLLFRRYLNLVGEIEEGNIPKRAKEISVELGMNYSSLRNHIPDLKKKKIIEKKSKGFMIPSRFIYRALKFIK